MENTTTPQSLSDADFMNQFDTLTASSNEASTNDTGTTNNVTEIPTVIEDTNLPDTSTTVEPETKSDEIVTDSTTSTVTTEEKPSQESISNTQEKLDETTNVPASNENTIDYKAFYESVTKDYKANGIMHPGIKDPEKFITALQMATDYAQKTSALKPIMRRAKLLDDISDEDLTEMLEFKKGNVEVIKKAMKQYSVDPITLDLEQIDYTAHSIVPSEQSIDFQTVVTKLSKNQELFQKVDDIVFKHWDKASRDLILNDNGTYLDALSEEVSSGRYDRIMPLLVQNKTFNAEFTRGKSDLDLYIELAKQEEINIANGSVKITPPNTNVTSTQQTVTPQVVVDPELESKKASAGISTTKQTNVKPEYNPVKLSDDEFMKLMNNGAFQN